jgi:hypothetical protein
MSKKLLSEAQVRRFARLANLSPINEMEYKRDEEEKVDELNSVGPMGNRDDENLEEAEEPEMEMGAEEMPPMEDAPEEEAPPMDDMQGDLDLTPEEASAIIELGEKLKAAMEGEEMESEPMPDELADEPMPEEAPEDLMAEALEGINYVPERKEIVEEVARRVAKRLLEAKRAQKSLDNALGKKPRRQKSRK